MGKGYAYSTVSGILLHQRVEGLLASLASRLLRWRMFGYRLHPEDSWTFLQRSSAKNESSKSS
jgi:hypothetical protein